MTKAKARPANQILTYIATAFALAAIATFAATGAAFSRSAPDSFADLAEELTPAVVNISTAQTVQGYGTDGIPMPQFPPGSPFEEFFKDFFERQQGGNVPRKVQSLGSGFVIDPDGYVVTNNHVIAEADEIKVNFTDGTTLDAEVVGRDPKTDLALLRVETDKPLAAVDFGDSDALRVGDWVMAIGNPFGLGGTVTAGIVSARNRDINAGPYDDFIQTDASINRGNSGGPLFDMEGRVIGVNTAIISPSGGSIGIGFAIPSTIATNVIAQLREYGETRRGWLGVRIQTVTDEIAESLGLDKPRGALVATITEDGPADEAGLEQGDVIVKFNGQNVPEMRDLPRMVADTEIGKKVPVVVMRGGKNKTYNVTIGRLPEEPVVAEAMPKSSKSKASGTETLGLTLAELTGELRVQYGIEDDVDGVLVVDVDPAGPAAEKRIQPGDVLVEVAQKAVSKPEEVVEQVEAASKSDRNFVLLLINRSGETSYVPVRIEDS